MDPVSKQVQLAAQVRRIVEQLQGVERRAEDLYLNKIALEVFDLELQLIEIHRKLLQLPPAAAAPAVPQPLEEPPF